MKKTLPLTLTVAMLLTGCASNIKQLGRIGDTTLYKVHSRSFDGPNNTVLFGLRDGETSPQAITSVGGPGIGAAIIGAGGNVASAAVFGLALRPDRSTSTVNTSVNAGSNSASGNHLSGSRHNRVDEGHEHHEKSHGHHNDRD